MPTETKNTTGVSYQGGQSVQDAAPLNTSNDLIDHADFIDMLDVLESLAQHTHNYEDKYYANCECQCGGGGMC